MIKTRTPGRGEGCQWERRVLYWVLVLFVAGVGEVGQGTRFFYW